MTKNIRGAFLESAGYSTNLKGAMDRHAQIVTDLGSTKQQKTAFSSDATIDPFDQTAEVEPDPIYPHEVMPNLKTPLPIVKAPDVQNTSSAVRVEPKDQTQNRQQLETSMTAYVEADAKIKTEFLAEMAEQSPEAAKAVGNMIPQAGGSSTAQLAMSLADDAIAPGVGSIATALNAIYKDNANPNSKMVQEAVSKTLDSLQAKAAEAKIEAKDNNKPLPPDFIDWEKFKTPKQVMDFMTRDIENDPWMQEARDTELAIEAHEIQGEEYAQYMEGNDASAEKVTVALEQGNTQAAANMLKSQTDVAAVLSAGELEMSKPGEYLSGIKLAGLDFKSLGKGADDIAELVKDFEPEFRREMKRGNDMTAAA